MNVDQIVREHAARVHALDPLVAGQTELPAQAEGDVLLTGEADGSAAAGLASVVDVDPDSFAATWGCLRINRLRARTAGSRPDVALGALIDRWLYDVDLGAPDSAAAVVWPSLDTAAVRALAVRGFAPLINVAVRVSADARVRPAGGCVVRPAEPTDVSDIVAMWLKLVAFDAQFGWTMTRPSTEARVREALAASLGEDECAWVAEVDGQVRGFTTVELPASAGWIAPVVADEPAAYLGAAYTEPGERGGGVGSALVARAHARLSRAGAEVVLLHHTLPNPLSTPFWSRQGYRPLLTQWVLRR